MRVMAAGVGPWDAWIREGTSKVHTPLPLILGSDIAGVVEALGSGVSGFRVGDAVYGVTNPEFCGGYAEYAVASAGMIASKPEVLSFVEAASVPVVAVTAWQMLFDYGHVTAGQTVLVHGAAGSVGAYAVQFAKQAQVKVFATASGEGIELAKRLGADRVIDYKTEKFEEVLPRVDVVLDTVGGETKRRSFAVLKETGILVSVVSANTTDVPEGREKQSIFFLVEVTTARLEHITQLFRQKKLFSHVGTALPLSEARAAHQMLAGAPHISGKIVLQVGA